MAFRQRGARGGRRLRADLPRRRRRRRPLLAPAEPGLRDRLQPGGDGLALPPQHRAGLHQAAERATARPRRCSTSSIRTASTCSGSRAGSAASTATLTHLALLAPAGDLLRHVRPRPLPDAVRAAVLALRLPAVHARVERGRRPSCCLRRPCAGELRRGSARVPLRRHVGLLRSAAAHARARVDPRYDDWRGRLLVAVLIYLGPLLRELERYRWRVRGPHRRRAHRIRERRRSAAAVAGAARVLRLALLERGRAGEGRAPRTGSMDALSAAEVPHRVDLGWSEWDLEIHRGIWSRGRSQGRGREPRRRSGCLRVRCALRTSRARPRRCSWARRSMAVRRAWRSGVAMLAAAGVAAGVVTAAGLLREAVGLGARSTTRSRSSRSRASAALCAAARRA